MNISLPSTSYINFDSTLTASITNAGALSLAKTPYILIKPEIYPNCFDFSSFKTSTATGYKLEYYEQSDLIVLFPESDKSNSITIAFEALKMGKEITELKFRNFYNGVYNDKTYSKCNPT